MDLQREMRLVKDITQGLWQKFHTKRRNVYMTLPDILSWKKKNIWDATRRNPFKALRWWYLKFIEIVRKFGFKEIEQDNSF